MEKYGEFIIIVFIIGIFVILQGDRSRRGIFQPPRI
jgi:hypothetical protein